MKRKVQPQKEGTAPKKQGFFKKNALDLVSLFVAIASLIATFYIGAQANELAKRTQPPYYSVSIDSEIKMFSYGGEMYTSDGLVFKQKGDMPSGEYSSVFLSTVKDDLVDIAYIPRNSHEQFEFTHESNNDLLFFMDDEDTSKLIFTPIDMNAVETINNNLQIFHIIFKGYSNDYSVFSVIFTLKEEVKPMTMSVNGKDEKIPAGLVNCYVLSESDVYTRSVYEKIAKDLNKGKEEDAQFTTKQIFETVTTERKLCCDKLSQSH